MKQYGVAAGFFLALIAVGLFPFLFLGRLFIDSDTMYQFYPFFAFYHEALMHGWSFLLNPTIFLGFPTYLSQTGGFLDPLNWVLFHIPLNAIDLYHVRVVIDLFLGMFFSYLLGRELNRSHAASILVGLGYIVAFNWRYLSNILIVNGLFLIPFLLYCALRIYRAARERERWMWIVLSGAAIAWSFMAGNAQFTVEGTFLFGLFYICYGLFVSSIKRDFLTYVRYAGYGIAILVVALVLAAPQILPTLKFTPLTVRSSGVDYSVAVYKVTEPGDPILFIFPDYLYFPYVSGGRKPLFIGAMLFFLALIGIREAWKRRDNTMRIISGLFAFAFVASLKWSPIFYLMLKLPVFNLFRFPYRWMYLGIWFLCFLGAYGFDTVYEHRDELRRSWLVRIVGAVVGVISLAILALNVLGSWFWNGIQSLVYWLLLHTVYGHGPFTKDPAHYVDALGRGIEAWQSFVSLADITFLVPFALLVSALVLIGALVWGKMTRHTFRYLTVALSVMTFLAVFILQWPSSIPRSVADSHAQLIQSAGIDDLSTYRTFPFMMYQALSIPPTYDLTTDQVIAVAELQYKSGWPDTNVYANAPSVDGYDVFVPVDYANALNTIGSTFAGANGLPQYTDAEYIKKLTTNLDVLGMLSGKYIFSGVSLTSPLLSLRATTTASHLGGTIFVYENKDALPTYYFAPRVVQKSFGSLPALLADASARSFALQTYIDCASCAASGVSSPGDSLTIKSQTFSRYEFATHTAHARYLVFGYNDLPGWHLTIDGKDSPIVRANGMLMATLVPEGDHTVVFDYRGILDEANVYETLGLFH